ncbi:cytochrome P450 [Lentzea sp. DG1S-22]|uniref:cytochrome P450 n=1 Tax=Lentzea sp. DG1S-22 TaxID=3108822 RepID=UPI002E761285|nr:cytochrome P450 [Lentzea sp. DG1S-22]WVH83363.1 cytochrome P450 [Lentzea sp. DG1S-22]
MTATRTEPPLPYRREPAYPCNPASELREAAAGQPVVRLPLTSGVLVWLVTGYDEARQVLADPRFSSNLTTPGTALPKPGERTLAEELQDRQPGTFLEYDPPDHTRLRGMVAGEFTAGAMHRLRPRIEAIVEECLDATEAAGPPADLVETFALPMPSKVICEMLGVPYEDDFDFAGHTLVMTDLMARPEDTLEARDALRGYMRRIVVDRRRNPTDDVLGRLIRNHGNDVTDEELVGIGNLLLIAGHETTAMMLSLGTLALLQHPAQLAMVRDEPSVVPSAVEELLRYTSIANHGAVRTATTDVMIGDRLIKEGDAVAVSIPMVNRDPVRFDDPYRFDVTRDPKAGQLAFGYGVHRCIAAPMARLEMQIAYPALLRRFPALRLAVPLEHVPVRTSNATHGLHALPVAW